MNLLVARDAAEELDTYRDWWRGHRVDGRDRDRPAARRRATTPCSPNSACRPSSSGRTRLRRARRRASGSTTRTPPTPCCATCTHSGTAGSPTWPAEPDVEHTAMRIDRVRAFTTTEGSRTRCRSRPTTPPRPARARPVPCCPGASAPPRSLRQRRAGGRRPRGGEREMGVAVPGGTCHRVVRRLSVGPAVRPSITSLTRDTVELGQRAASSCVSRSTRVAAAVPTRAVADPESAGSRPGASGPEPRTVRVPAHARPRHADRGPSGRPTHAPDLTSIRTHVRMASWDGVVRNRWQPRAPEGRTPARLLAVRGCPWARRLPCRHPVPVWAWIQFPTFPRTGEGVREELDPGRRHGRVGAVRSAGERVGVAVGREAPHPACRRGSRSPQNAHRIDFPAITRIV